MAVNGKEMLRTFLCGLAMGAADVVPGVSGGTIAFITGIYQKLLDAIAAFNLSFFRRLLGGKVREALAAIPWSFLVPLVCGIFCSIFSLARLVLHLLETRPILVWAFFFGLILASIILLMRSLTDDRPEDRPGTTARGKIHPATVPAAMAGALFAWWLTGADAMTTGHSLPTTFLVGFVAICAMILPGISGAFILVLLGQYEFVLSAVTTFNLPVLLTFATGAACGLLSFARALKACLARFRAPTLALLTGVMAGSLRVVWPWKAAGLPILPQGMSSETALALACLVAGLATPLAISTLQRLTNRAT